MYSNQISLRIALWYTVAFVTGSLILFVLTGYFLATSLQNKDRELLNVKFQDYATLFKKEGVEGIRVRTALHTIADARKFFVRLEDKDGKTLFLYAPEDAHADWPTIQDIDLFLQKQSREKLWLSIPGKNGYGDSIEVLSRRLPSGEILQVAKDIEDRENVLKSFARSFLFAWVPVLGLTLLFGFFLSNKLLQPIRWLINTVQSIRAGNQSARVPRQNNHNELEQLTRLFNEMLDQNEKLIRGMRETLDYVAHDLRTPIMRLQLSAENVLSLNSDSSKDLALYREALSDCKENSDTILEILNAIMTISEAEAGTIPLKKEDVPCAELIDSVIDLYGFVAEEKGITLKVAPVDPALCCLGDKTRLMQALANLVDNAIKYSPQGSQVELSVNMDGEFAFLNVKDQGPGISEEDLPRIWDRLYRADKSRSTRGLGLGLTLVKAIVQAHRGEVKVQCNQGVGCVFSLKIPRNYKPL